MAKYLRITMDDGSKWDVPAQVIAEHRAKYYAEHDTKEADNTLTYDEIFKEEVKNCLEDDYEIEDWAANNMDWKDVEAVAVKVEQKEPDYQEGWMNGEKEIIEK